MPLGSSRGRGRQLPEVVTDLEYELVEVPVAGDHCWLTVTGGDAAVATALGFRSCAPKPNGPRPAICTWDAPTNVMAVLSVQVLAGEADTRSLLSSHGPC